MRCFPRLMLIVLWPALATSEQALTSVGPLAYYAVERAIDPIIIDGKLDEFSWERSNQINNLDRILNDYADVHFATRSKMLWDDEYFYFSFVCQDADIWAIYENEDDRLWEEEVVEVFIDPDGDGKNYLELEVNPQNVVVDLLVYSISPEWVASIDWDINGLKTAVSTHGSVNDSLQLDQGWTAEIAIPWAAMADSVTGGARPVSGDIWRLNLYRIERKGGRDLKKRIDNLQAQAAPIRAAIDTLWVGHQDRDESQLDPQSRQQLTKLNTRLAPIIEALSPLQTHYGQQTEYTAWSETYQQGFHHPERFGAIQFVE